MFTVLVVNCSFRMLQGVIFAFLPDYIKMPVTVPGKGIFLLYIDSIMMLWALVRGQIRTITPSL